jgi:kynureninase
VSDPRPPASGTGAVPTVDAAAAPPLPAMKPHFARFLGAVPGRLHAVAHSHHPWPDVSLEAHRRAWLDAAELADGKWERIFGEVLPEARRPVAAVLGLPAPDTVAVAANTHELVVKVLSCLDPPRRVLTTTNEFYSFARQINRLEEDGSVEVERVAVTPYETFVDRFVAAAARGGHDLVYVSHVFFDTAFRVTPLEALVRAVPDEDTFVVIDGYHGFMAVPTDLSAIADRVFYLTGGYKYAMAGEGACGMHCPPGYGPRPRITGWFAGFGQLAEGRGDQVAYADDGTRFLGATLDPTPWYRFNAVQRWLDELGVTVAGIHAHVARLQGRFLDLLDARGVAALAPDRLVLLRGAGPRGNFLTFAVDDGEEVHGRLARAGVMTDRRGDVVRVGFGCYHDVGDVEELVDRAAAAL